MSKMRKFAGLLVAMLMICAMAITASAATNYTITAPDNGHNYQVYQIFTGDLSEGILSNVVAGANFTGTDAKTAATAIEAATGSDAEKLAVITPYVDLSSTPFTTITTERAVSVPAGYYLIKDVDGATVGANDASTLYIVQVVSNIEITPKTGVPTVEKKVYDEEKGWQDSNDYDIGDSIDYKLTATLDDISAFSTYYIQFDDKLTEGLTYNNDAIVYAVNEGSEDVDISSYFTIRYDEDTMTLWATCNDIKSIEGATIGEGTKIVVKYSTTLNEDAVIGSTGNPNEVKLIYSNNPNVGKEGEKGETPKDKVTVFTYKLVVNKFAGSGTDKTALNGAGFTLYKGTGDAKVAVGTEQQYDDSNVFTWEGIDSGVYTLVETTVPAGYNKADDIEFKVVATYEATSDDPQLTGLEVRNADGTTVLNTFTATVNAGEVKTDVSNFRGATLPTTGGMGTTMFYLIGALCVVFAGVLLISKKRVAR